MHEPAKIKSPFNHSFAKKRERRLVVFVKAHSVGEHVNILVGTLFELFYFLRFFAFYNVVRVEPHYVIARCRFESKIPCGGKIVTPGKIKNVRRKRKCNVDRFVRRPRVDDYYFVGINFRGFQRAG